MSRGASLTAEQRDFIGAAVMAAKKSGGYDGQIAGEQMSDKEQTCAVPWRLELDAIEECVEALLPLAPEDRQRALRYLADMFGGGK